VISSVVLAIDDSGTTPRPPHQAAMPQSITLATHATAAGSNVTRYAFQPISRRASEISNGWAEGKAERPDGLRRLWLSISTGHLRTGIALTLYNNNRRSVIRLRSGKSKHV
jgi:hypothetical protein